MENIFIICWKGRDHDTGIWDVYPCFDIGFYESYETAQNKADELNKTEPQDYDEEADDFPTYIVQVVDNAE
jgi:hypothetical protein